MSDVTAEDVQNLRQLRYEEMQKLKSQLKEQDQKWQDVSTGRKGEHGALLASLKESKVLKGHFFLDILASSTIENVLLYVLKTILKI